MRLRQHLVERRQQGTIRGPQARPADLAPQHLQLMPQHEDLDLLRPLRTTKEIAQETNSLPRLHQPGRARRSRRASFWDPHEPPRLRKNRDFAPAVVRAGGVRLGSRISQVGYSLLPPSLVQSPADARLVGFTGTLPYLLFSGCGSSSTE